jgi:hypothetical protein
MSSGRERVPLLRTEPYGHEPRLAMFLAGARDCALARICTADVRDTTRWRRFDNRRSISCSALSGRLLEFEASSFFSRARARSASASSVLISSLRYALIGSLPYGFPLDRIALDPSEESRRYFVSPRT